MSDVRRAVSDLWTWAAGRGMTAQQWRGACVALGYIHGTRNLTLEQYVLLKDEIFSLLGVQSDERQDN